MERQKRKQEEEQQYLLRQQQQQLQQAQGKQPHMQTHMSQISQTHMYAGQTHVYAGQGVHSDAQVARAWQSYTDKATGCMYYHNTITKVTQWDRPPCFDVPQQQAKCSQKSSLRDFDFV
jgi:hypothetical protein